MSESSARSVVTGGCGFVGAALVRQLLGHGDEVLVLDNFARGGPERLPVHARLSVKQVDIRDTAAVGEQVSRFDPAVVYHLAAIHFIPYCNEHPEEALEVNLRGTQSVLDVVSGAGKPGLVFISSAAVYPPSLEPCAESMKPGPTDIYGYSKWAGELVVEKGCRDAGVAAVLVRLFNVFGPGETNPHVIPHIIGQLRAGARELELGNIEPQRDYIYVEDVASTLIRIRSLASSDCPAINLGTGTARSVRQILESIRALTGWDVRTRVHPGLVRKNDRPLLLADTSNSAEADLGIDAAEFRRRAQAPPRG